MPFRTLVQLLKDMEKKLELDKMRMDLASSSSLVGGVDHVLPLAWSDQCPGAGWGREHACENGRGWLGGQRR